MLLVERADADATAELRGVRRRISLMLCPEAVVGDHVLVHAGYALSRVDAAEAQETLRLLDAALQQEPDPQPPARPEQPARTARTAQAEQPAQPRQPEQPAQQQLAQPRQTEQQEPQQHAPRPTPHRQLQRQPLQQPTRASQHGSKPEPAP